MYINLKFGGNQNVLIELFNNSATIKLFDRFSMYNSLDNWHIVPLNYDFNSVNQSPSNYQDQIRQSWYSIKLALMKLRKLNFKIPFEIPEVFNYDQQLLNKLHRFFTYNSAWYLENSSNTHLAVTSNLYDPNFIIEFDDFYTWHKIIDPINLSCHFLETFTNNANKNLLLKYSLNSLCINLKKSGEFDANWIEFNSDEQQENYKYQEYYKLKKPLVLLDNCILGKSYLQSFLNNDDPNAIDCTGRLGSHCNFLIDLNEDRNKLYNSSEFKIWLLKFGIKNPTLEFPIGFVVYPELTVLNKIISNSEIEEISFFKIWPGHQESNLDL